MEWIAALGRAINYIEDNLKDASLTTDRIAEEVAISSFYFQKGFAILTGFSVGEYIRNRRLYMAALDIAKGTKVIDAALDYGWETPESFTKAFSRFHGTSPQNVKADTHLIKVFLPLKISVTVNGGNRMNYRVEKMESFSIIGIEREFCGDNAYQKIPEFWNELYEKYYLTFCDKPEYEDALPTNPVEKAFKENNVGQFGVCVEPEGRTGTFDYYVAGQYQGGDIPPEMEVYDLPALTWAKFECTGPMPGALQSVNTEIFKTWLPTNGKYEIAAGFNIEWYSDDGTPDDADYRSEIWIPVREL